MNQKFTGQERDPETGLDYFQARYFGSGMGRFSSPDPGNAGVDLSDPQTWNGYAYVRNSAVSAVDPSGMDTCSDGSWASVCVSDSGPGSIDLVSVCWWCWEYGYPYTGPSQPAQLRQPAPPTHPAPPIPSKRNNCVAGFTAAGAGVGVGVGAFVGGGAGAIGGAGLGAVSGTLVAPIVGTIGVGIAGGIAGEAAGAAGGALVGGGLGAGAGYLLGSIVCSSSTGDGGGTGGGKRVTFGHGARHLADSGLNQNQVEAAIEAQVKEIAQSSSSTGSFWGKVVVNGQQIFYRAFTLPDGTINVGTYTVGAP